MKNHPSRTPTIPQKCQFTPQNISIHDLKMVVGRVSTPKPP